MDTTPLMLNYFQILILAIIQGACELLPVSSSAHVIAAEKIMGIQNAGSPEMAMLLVMLHTGTMFAVIVYFWNGWRRDYFQSTGQVQWFVIQIIVATVCTLAVGLVLKETIEKVFMRGVPHAAMEDLFNNLPLIASALAVVGVLIIYAGWQEDKAARKTEIQPTDSVWVGLVQGICVPFRGFSRSGATISTGLLLGLPKQKLEEFSFALAVVLTPLAVAREAWRVLKDKATLHESITHMFAPGIVGMVFSFIAGLLALKWLSRWLEGGRWSWFGYYCLAAAAGVLVIHFKFPG